MTTLEELEEKLAKRTWWDNYKWLPFRIWNRILDIKNEIKFGFQRMFRGYDDTAFWGLDGYLTEIVLPVLKDYRNGGMAGIPGSFEEEGENFEEACKRWDLVLDKMIEAFQIMHDDDYSCPDGQGAPDIEIDKDAYWKWHDVRNKKVEEGLQLFGKHFRGLWD